MTRANRSRRVRRQLKEIAVKNQQKGQKETHGQLFCLWKAWQRAQDFYRKASAMEAKGKANVAESGPSSKNE